jgi:hypothetical protein
MRAPHKLILAGLIAACAFFLLGCAYVAGACDGLTFSFGLGSAGMAGMALLMADGQLKQTKALPNGANSTVTDGFDLGHDSRGDVLAQFELKLSAPALTTGQLADTQTITYHVEHDDDPAFGTVSTLLSSIALQTGAAGAGDAAKTANVRLPIDSKRYVRVKATKAGASNASTASMTVELVF